MLLGETGQTHIDVWSPTLPGVSLVSMYGLGVYTPALPDVSVVARSSSVLMQAILLFVFTSYEVVHTRVTRVASEMRAEVRGDAQARLSLMSATS